MKNARLSCVLPAEEAGGLRLADLPRNCRLGFVYIKVSLGGGAGNAVSLNFGENKLEGDGGEEVDDNNININTSNMDACRAVAANPRASAGAC